MTNIETDPYLRLRNLFANGEATHINGALYAVRPKGALGTCGWVENIAWSIQYVHATDVIDALNKTVARWN
jgi:hypothetical protein